MIIEIEVDEALSDFSHSAIGRFLGEVSVETIDEDGYHITEYDYRDSEVDMLANGYPQETIIHRAWIRKECEAEIYETLDKIRKYIRERDKYYNVYLERVFDTDSDPDLDKQIMDGAFD